MKILKRSELTDFDVRRDVSLTVEGNGFCALQSKDLQSGNAGFGKTPQEAIHNLEVKLKALTDSDTYNNAVYSHSGKIIFVAVND